MSSLHPQTPQSPSQLSPSTVDPASSVQSTMSSFTTALPTPAHSVNGSGLPSESNHDVIMGEDSPQKRKREQGDTGEQDREKRVHIDDGMPSMQAIHEDVGEKYLLLQRTWTPRQPILSEDLFEVYGLTGIAGEVARVLPDGTKNAMRKTYKGQIKKLGLTGHFDAVKKEPNDRDGFLSLIDCPPEEWHVLFEKAQEIENGLKPEVQRALPKATTMIRGPIAKDKWDSSVLADFAGDRGARGTPKVTAPGTPLHPASGGTAPRLKGQTPGVQDAARPRRAGKKRSYGDNSFEGYGDGFQDDETGADTGYSTGEGEGTKRKKKTAPSRVGTPRQMFGHAGPGMLGA
ncbi:hypothetical protein M406DRAFT_105569 [Cryphonectria parasitica EP155]|uniref:Mediator of RNA polymerase II transcription subunit 19 n=1 Tax=Cryphonectria parasitica (strain ATCC 38755 / EP155) TaxID=660469 RepID=A0A9P5CV92_CRYP1|nr:uncharacterized protein M406DRAFT_105569 [Cryphonectria parasitica EP155]KAF3770946.1 hypothetical protein M406DRAFT_105569 [Cryphonectria parasitica EP155]